MSNKKTEYIQVRVEPKIQDAIDTLAETFSMTRCDIIRAMLNIVLGNWAPFTPAEAQEAIILQRAIEEASDGEDS